MKTEIIIQLKSKNKYIVTVQGELHELISEEFSKFVYENTETFVQLRLNSYMLNRFSYWLKSKDFEIEYKELY